MTRKNTAPATATATPTPDDRKRLSLLVWNMVVAGGMTVEDRGLLAAAVNAYTAPKSAGSSTPSDEQLAWARETANVWHECPPAIRGFSLSGLIARRLAEREAGRKGIAPTREGLARGLSNIFYHDLDQFDRMHEAGRETWRAMADYVAAAQSPSPLAVVALREALERSREELKLAEEQWLAPSKDGLFQSRVSVLLEKIDAALSTPAGEGK